MNNINFNELTTKGFCVVRNFLNTDELSLVSKDFNLIKETKFENPNFNIFPVGKHINLDSIWHTTVDYIAESIKTNTEISTNYTSTPIYFSIKHGINFGYHQDHDSWFLYGDHANYLNIWVPIIKPTEELTNVTIINFERLFKDHPELEFLKNYGATRAESYKIIDDNLDKVFNLDFNLEDYAETPFLKVVDALIMRGDALHRTQDTLTDRVAISIRRLNTESKVHKDHFNITSSVKKQIIESNPKFYQKILDQFIDKDECTVGDLL